MTLLLETRALVKRFGGLVATDHVELAIEKGEIHALIGPNGAGKSTLINQLCGELFPDNGQILLEGRDITDLPAAERVRRGLGRTFQITSLLDQSSVRDNVGMAVQARLGHNGRIWDRRAGRRDLWQETDTLLAESGLAERAGTPCADLSHGEKKQLELLMAMTGRPRLMLLDEPMAGLGHAESREMVARLQELRRSATVLLVEHDMEAVFALADRISVLVYGRIIATGTVDEIRNDPQVHEAYLGGEDGAC
ncbi:MAG: ABC transporter ATP-binding protein [Geminicoccaceae bacterium]|nr:ABC transporter ATP-binding protein [Geminicoccaceae bacterium]